MCQIITDEIVRHNMAVAKMDAVLLNAYTGGVGGELWSIMRKRLGRNTATGEQEQKEDSLNTAIMVTLYPV